LVIIMSRIGKKPLAIPEGIEVIIAPKELKFTSDKGSLSLGIPPGISIRNEEGQLLVERKDDQRRSKSFQGTTRQLLANILAGLVNPWEKTLEVVGVGYRAVLEGNDLVLSVGFSHPVRVSPQEGIKFTVEEGKIKVLGIDKALVGRVAADIRMIRPPDPYKGVGIRYLGEQIKLKPGKIAKAGATGPAGSGAG